MLASTKKRSTISTLEVASRRSRRFRLPTDGRPPAEKMILGLSVGFALATSGRLATGVRCHALRGMRTTAAMMAKPDADTKRLLDEIEQKGLSAAEAWDTYSTDFLAPDMLAAAVSRLDARGDLTFTTAGGHDDASRARLVVTNPEMMDVGGPGSTAADAVLLLRVCADFDQADPMPNVLDNIGVSLASVGDVLIDGDEAFLVISPEVAKQVQRLLPKALPACRTVEALEAGAAVSGQLQEMEVRRLDTRVKR